MKKENEVLPELTPQYECDNNEEMNYVEDKRIFQILQEEDENDLLAEVKDSNALKFDIYINYILRFFYRNRMN